jgi:hypothetical protein
MKEIKFAVGEKGEVLLQYKNEYVVVNTGMQLWRRLHDLWMNDKLYTYKGAGFRSKLKKITFDETAEGDLSLSVNPLSQAPSDSR